MLNIYILVKFKQTIQFLSLKTVHNTVEEGISKTFNSTYVYGE